MHRCLELSKLGAGNVAPNPMVGAVLVCKDNIIGEGYHMQYGKAHAEPNCLSSVRPEHRHLIEQSTLYVSLEPCAHFGKTPPCADLIIQNKISKVVVGCRDPFIQVNGKGIEKLRAAGCDVTTGILEKECQEMNKRFFTFHTRHRPYIILKWAETLDKHIANEDHSRLFITNEYTNRLVHRWRSEEMGIVVGTNTALYDDPELTTRLWPGNNPIRIVVDMDLRLPASLKLYNGSTPTIVFNKKKHSLAAEKKSTSELNEIGVGYYQITEDVSLVHQMLNGLYHLDIQSILIEGGRNLLQSFIDDGMWDEARVICNEQMTTGSGLTAPVLRDQYLVNTERHFSDVIHTYKNSSEN